MTDYDKLLTRLVKGAEYLENPLIKPVDYELGMKLYNELERQVLEYKRKEKESDGRGYREDNQCA